MMQLKIIIFAVLLLIAVVIVIIGLIRIHKYKDFRVIRYTYCDGGCGTKIAVTKQNAKQLIKFCTDCQFPT